MWRVLIVLVASLFVLAAMPLIAADHAQTAPNGEIRFDHRTGNEWWVEVVLSGSAAASVTGVQAMDTNGAWVTLTKRDWGAWAASFHIEPGHEVRFRATWSSGTVESCWFSHPAGVERCATSGEFDASFSGVKGNEWWVQVNVQANQPLAGVEARINCGDPWRALTLRSWGSWAASFHIPSGSKIDFRARSTTGAQDLSGGYIWPQATPTSGCGTSPAFDASFSDVSGNNWWVQVKVRANEPLAGVDARYDCGAWKPLRLQSWGFWAESFFLPSGSKVDFRARSTDGDTDLSGGYTWTQATPTTPCPVMPEQSPAWTTSMIHDGVPIAGVRDMATGIISNWTTRTSMVSATNEGPYWTYYSNGAYRTEWLNEARVISVAIGDAERDGDTEVYLGGNNGDVYVLVPSGPGGLYPFLIANLNGEAVETLVVGDADGDGFTELYAGTRAGEIYQISGTRLSEFNAQLIATTGTIASSSRIGDGDNQAGLELYVGGHGGTIHRIQKTATGWTTTLIFSLCCDTSTRVTGIVTADADADGRREIYAAFADGLLRKFTLIGDAWTRENIAAFDSPLVDLSLHDRDLDGKPELYLVQDWTPESRGSDVWRVHYATGWTKTLLGRVVSDYGADSMAVADIDGAGGAEIFVGTTGGDIFVVKP